MGLRQLHYSFFSARRKFEYPNTEKSYKRLSAAVTKARRAYRDWELQTFNESADAPDNTIPPDWMMDETRDPEEFSSFSDLVEFAENMRHWYFRDNWQDQLNYCEMWSEKGTVLGTMREVAKEFR